MENKKSAESLAQEIVIFSNKLQTAIDEDKNYLVPAKIIICMIRELDILKSDKLGKLDNLILSRFKTD